MAARGVASDVIVVGAGAAGLFAARQLALAGRGVKVLEGRNRIGGRLLSKVVAGAGLDLGATWFWDTEPRIKRLIADLEIETHPQYLAGDAVLQTEAGVQRVRGNPIDAPSGRFRLGAAVLADRLRDQLPAETLQLEAVVTSITEHPNAGLSVQSTAGDFSASQVILAVPPATAVASIDFSPELPDPLTRLASLTPVWMGTTIKAVAAYHAPFWRDAGLAGAAMSYVGPLREVHDMSGPGGQPAALFGFIQPKPSEPATTEQAVLAQLLQLFGPEAANPRQLWIQDWRAEALTSPPGSNPSTAYEQTYGHPRFSEPAMNGQLHWAATETSAEAPGHIEGALAAAQRAVDRVLHATRGR